MKARIKATGEIVEVSPYWTEIHTTNGGCYEMTEVELMPDVPDYWTRLEHQAAIAAMQGILSNHNLYGSIIQMTQVSRVAIDYAQELVEKMKEERK